MNTFMRTNIQGQSGSAPANIWANRTNTQTNKAGLIYFLSHEPNLKYKVSNSLSSCCLSVHMHQDAFTCRYNSCLFHWCTLLCVVLHWPDLYISLTRHSALPFWGAFPDRLLLFLKYVQLQRGQLLFFSQIHWQLVSGWHISNFLNKVEQG